MIKTDLLNLLDELLVLSVETEWVEFKEAKQNYDFNKLGKYVSALSNEANLKHINRLGRFKVVTGRNLQDISDV